MQKLPNIKYHLKSPKIKILRKWVRKGQKLSMLVFYRRIKKYEKLNDYIKINNLKTYK